LPRDNLTEHEKSIPEDHPLVRAIMFLMYATGSPLLPRNNSKIDVRFLLLYSSERSNTDVVCRWFS
jgi:hypothetical protein